MATSALSTATRFLLAALGVAATVAAVGFLGATSARRTLRSWRWSPLPAAVLAVAVFPAAHYSWVSARNAGTGIITDDTLGFDHWPAQAALPIAVLLTAVVAVGHPTGWRLPAWLVGACAVWFAVVSLAEPNLAGSISRAWSTAVIVWSVVFLVAVRYSAGRPVVAL